MPPYYSVRMTIDEFSPGHNISLSSVYNSLLINDFKFGGKYPAGDGISDRSCQTECESDDELECIIAWNQERFDQNFRIGWTQPWQEGYQQFLLIHPLYNHCRVITSSKDISIIVPEITITFSAFEYYEGIQSINLELIHPLKEIALSAWSTHLITSVQTAPENGGITPYQKLTEGNLPFICPFAIIDQECSQTVEHLYAKRDIRQEKRDTGILLTSTEAVYGR